MSCGEVETIEVRITVVYAATHSVLTRYLMPQYSAEHLPSATVHPYWPCRSQYLVMPLNLALAGFLKC